MSKKTPAAPAQPDPAATAASQAAANKETAIAQGQLNMINQATPWGNLEYTERGKTAEGTPQYTVTQTLDPAQQELLDLSNAASKKYGETANAQMDAVRGTLSQPLDFSSLGAAAAPNETMRQSVYDSMMGRLKTQFDRDRAAMETSLANQGITIGSDAHNAAMDQFNRALTDARLAADTSALGQMGTMYGLEASARDKAINEMVMQRSQPLNELAAMMSGSQVTNPQFVGTPQVSMQAPDIMGATYANYNGAQNAYNQQVASNNAMTGGLFGLGASAIPAAAYFFK